MEAMENMNPTEQGWFCLACQKEVVDFRHYSDEQLIDFFTNSAPGTCGMYTPQQLGRPLYSGDSVTAFSASWRKGMAAGLILLTIFGSEQSFAQAPQRPARKVTTEIKHKGVKGKSLAHDTHPRIDTAKRMPPQKPHPLGDTVLIFDNGKK